MPEIFNLNEDLWDRREDRPGWRSKGARVGAHVGAELIGGSMYELEPGNRLWPYHTHHANEEWLLVVRGRPTLRTPEGERELIEGDVLAFRRGEDGLHQISNRTDVPVRVLMLSTLIAPDLVHYPDSGKFGARDVKGERVLLARPGPTLDYWDGEQ
ncbi:MAG: cupin domain-containing protein [Actinomycetota bacterium]|nr:cupin domain-containing protein [Actinomycetota bacterium]